MLVCVVRRRVFFLKFLMPSSVAVSSFLPVTLQYVQSVKRVGTQIVKHSGMPQIQNLKWEFVVIDAPVVNAMVLPGMPTLPYSLH